MQLRIGAAICAILSYVIVNYGSDLYASTRYTYPGTFCQLYLAFFTLWIVWKVILWPRYFSPLRNLPTPEGASCWAGHFKQIYKEARGKPHCDWVNSIPNNGLIRYLSLFNSERLLVVSPEALAEVLTTKSYDFKKPENVILELKQLLGMGILLAEGQEHRIQRKILLPAFSFRHIKSLYSVFWGKSIDVVTALTDEVKTKAKQMVQLTNSIQTVPLTNVTADVDIADWVNRAALDIIGITAIGKDFGAIRNSDSVLNQTYKRVFGTSNAAIFLGVLRLIMPDWLVRHLPFRRNKDVRLAVQTIRGLCSQLICQQKEKFKDGFRDNRDILSIVLENGGLTEDQLIDQLMTFLAAGHETTATTLTWAIYLLCVHPQVQNTLRQEIWEKLPSFSHSDGDFKPRELSSLIYLNAVCSEVLRYAAPVPLTLRVAAVNTTILNQKVPMGTKIVLAPRATNRDESLWGPDAQAFNPVRWLSWYRNGNDTSSGSSSNYATITFLHGPRSCIGQSFAKTEVAILLAALVGKFEFELKDQKDLDERNLNISRGVTAKLSSGLFVKVTLLEGW